MYNYKLINNHYIVFIDETKFLIDTGSPNSFWITKPMNEITIDGNCYRLHSKPSNYNVEKGNQLVGMEVDGFIGMDIISQTSLTIYKNGTLKFTPREIDGKQTPMSTEWPLTVSIGGNSMTGKFIIDTGAKYGYGVSGLFYQKTPFDTVKDYNPSFGDLMGDIFHLNINICGQTKEIDVCNNMYVALSLKRMGAIMIGSISSLFEEVCVIDTKKGRLILK